MAGRRRWSWLLGTPSQDRLRDEQDLKDEIDFHLRTETERRIDRGQSPDEARRAALREFGNVPLVEEVTRGMWQWTSRERLAHDLRFALRTLRRDLSFSAVALTTLGLGIGATVVIFTIVHTVLLRPLPFPDPDRLVMVWERSPQGNPRNMVNAPNFVDWRSRNQVFDAIGVISRLPLNLAGLGTAEQVDGVRVSADVFAALGVAPELGRVIQSGEDVAGGFRSLVLTHGFWQRRYGGSPQALGQTLTVNGDAHTIVGVMPATFSLPGIPAELFIPLQLDFSALPRGRSLLTVARIKAGLSLDAARADMDRVAAQLATERRQLNAGYGASVIPLMDQAVGDTRRILWVVFGAVGCLLLLASANVANLLLMRATTRAQEMAVRLALGAGRWRLVHQLIMESLVLAVGATALGLLLAVWLVPLVPTLFPPAFPLPRGNEISIDGTVIAFTVGLAVAVAIFFGLVPAMQATAVRPIDPLRAAARTVVGTRAGARRTLVVVEIALALMLVLGAGLMGRSLVQLYKVDVGFDTTRVLSLRMLMIPAKYREPRQRIAFLGDVLNRVRSTPGVSAASSIHFLPLIGIGSSTRYFRSDRPEPERDALERAGGDVSVVSDDYFRTMGIRLIDGRDFAASDHVDAPRVVIVNETLATSWFPDGSPVGKHLSLGWSTPTPLSFEIIGVVSDVRGTTIDVAPRPGVYLAHTQEPSALATLVVRSDVAAPSSLAPAVRAAIAKVDPDQGVSQVQTLDAVVSGTTARPRVQAILLGSFGVLALLIASVGLYGVMSYGVEQRRREMGVRLALGAEPATLLRLVLREALTLAVIGIGVGSLLAMGAQTSLSGLLYETRASDPRVLAGVGVVLAVVAAVAALIPALRATRVDPMIVLRDQ
jgi:predicted permease